MKKFISESLLGLGVIGLWLLWGFKITVTFVAFGILIWAGFSSVLDTLRNISAKLDTDTVEEEQ